MKELESTPVIYFGTIYNLQIVDICKYSYYIILLDSRSKKKREKIKRR